MHPAERFLRSANLWPQQLIHLDPELFSLLEDLAADEGTSVQSLVRQVLYTVVEERYAQAHNVDQWDDLTPRQQQVAALTCLGYTNREMAKQLIISVHTVRSHMRQVLDKYQVASKAELRIVLAGWDFDDWLSNQHIPGNNANHPVYADSSSAARATK